ncbi:CRISPR-associated endoribonuclease Cas6 [bacterium]|nr:CRISPR-associated endoribonuclease Cas6 [bacterium]
MRLEITLQNPSACSIPVNYQYPLSAAIYRILNAASAEFAQFLHEHGYIGQDGKPRKLYTFSFLNFKDRYILKRNRFHLKAHSSLSFILSSPMLQDFIQNFVQGLFVSQIIRIGVAEFYIMQVESLPDPEFQSPMVFRPLSPIVVATMIDTSKGVKTYYYRTEDEELPEAVRQNLIKKHQTAYGRPPDDNRLNVTIDKEYLEKQRRSGKPVSKLIILCQGRPDETRIKGFVVPIKMKGSDELMKTAWECGVGDKCSMGFGCVGM